MALVTMAPVQLLGNPRGLGLSDSISKCVLDILTGRLQVIKVRNNIPADSQYKHYPDLLPDPNVPSASMRPDSE